MTEDAVIQQSLAGVITGWNPAAEAIFRVSAQESIGCHVSKFISLTPPNDQATMIARLRTGERIPAFETVCIRSGGSCFAALLTLIPIESAGGEVTAALSIVRDESTHRLKPLFLSTLSHELRTPLNSIIGFTGIILEGMAGPVNAEQTRQLGIVRGSAWHLLSLINDALDISRIEAGRLQIRLAPFSILSAVRKTMAIVEPLAAAKQLRLRLTTQPGLDLLDSDQRRVEQVLINLLNNAIKFTVRGEVGMSVLLLDGQVLRPGTPPQSCVQFSVADTGVGIDQADLATLFEPFRQLNVGPAGRHEGTGLGLTISSRLAELLGGWIRVTSTRGEGSIFSFLVPCIRAH